MEKRDFGNTGLAVSRLTFGCGAVGGLMTKGDAADQDRAIHWARDHGINFFDTAASYGDGISEDNLGRALNGNKDGLVVSTKVGIGNADLGDVGGAIRRSLEASLKRLRLDHVDIFQLHNTLGRADFRGNLTIDQVMDAVVPAFDKLRDSGKVRFLGFTAKGEPDDVHRLIGSGVFRSAQVFYNLLVPSAGEVVPAGYPADDFRQLLDVAADHGVGAIGVRVLAGGALSGSEKRHLLGMAVVTPIGSDSDYKSDVERARQFLPLVEAGHVDSLPELAIRYAISHPALPTTEIGIATLDELQQATAAVNKGPLSLEALAQIKNVQAGFVI
ncbi:MAG: aldo/keto reductase [Candidatus Puniceispirillum sp.]|nr:aldo/keto reductase [Candidatus Puniceispirillum sp.]